MAKRRKRAIKHSHPLFHHAKKGAAQITQSLLIGVGVAFGTVLAYMILNQLNIKVINPAVASSGAPTTTGPGGATPIPPGTGATAVAHAVDTPDFNLL